MRVDIWSDVICPWCYVGKARFSSALSSFAHRDEVEVVYRSFELDPSYPKDSHETTFAMLSRKYGMSEADARAAESRIAGLAAAEGLGFEPVRPVGNTFDIHRVLQLGLAKGVQAELVRAVDQAYFAQGRPVFDADVITGIAAGAGLDADLTEAQVGRGNVLAGLKLHRQAADAYRAAGQPADAIRLYRRTLADRERIQGPQHPDTMTARQKLADAYLADGRLKDALAQYKRVLADRERVLGPDHLDTIRACGNLASADHSAGRMASAVRYYEQASAGYERILGPEHPDTLACRANLAHAYYAVGRLTAAPTLLRETVARCERALPPGDSLTRAVRESLANIAGDGSARG